MKDYPLWNYAPVNPTEQWQTCTIHIHWHTTFPVNKLHTFSHVNLSLPISTHQDLSPKWLQRGLPNPHWDCRSAPLWAPANTWRVAVAQPELGTRAGWFASARSHPRPVGSEWCQLWYVWWTYGDTKGKDDFDGPWMFYLMIPDGSDGCFFLYMFWLFIGMSWTKKGDRHRFLMLPVCL